MFLLYKLMLLQFSFHEIKLYWQFPGHVIARLKETLTYVSNFYYLLILLISIIYNINTNIIVDKLL
jgi:hypothetical protein